MSNHSRREAYAFYRSMGYSSKEAAAMRNRSPGRLISEYRTAARKHNQSYRDDWDGKEIPEKPKKPYRPDFDVFENQEKEVPDRLSDLGLTGGWIDQVMESDDAISVDVYADRFNKLGDYFDNNPNTPNFKSILDDLSDVEDLGDLLDILGDMYTEAEG